MKWNEKLPFPKDANTGSKIKDGIFNWVLKRYRKFNHPWTKSDDLVWRKSIYLIGDFAGIIFFFWIMLTIINFSYKRYGEWRTLFYVMVILMFRINMLSKQIGILNKKF